MSKILICVDCQYDFIEGGNLPVAGARKAMNYLTRFLKKHNQDYAAVLCTLDWHPQGHCSFAPQGGQWPVHCVQHTHGAALYQSLVDVLPSARTHFFLKGSDIKCDEYSFLSNKKNVVQFERIIKKINPDEIHVCGIAGDVCVLNTAASLIEMGEGSKLAILLKATASIDEEVTSRFIDENNIEVIK